MAQYAIMHIAKIKSTEMLTLASNHNFRKVLASNVDQALISEDRQIKGDYGVSYAKVFKDAVKESDYYKTHDVAKNAVLGCEVLLTMSREMKDKVDIDKWCEANVKWLEKEFGENNVKNAVLHLDEETPHIHAFVVPFNEKGRLSAKHYINGKKGLAKLQDSYANRMHEFGLNRGITKSRAKRKDIKEYYHRIDEALSYADIAYDRSRRQGNETEAEYTDRLHNMVSNMALKIRENEEKLKESERKLHILSKTITDLEAMNDIVKGDDFVNMVQYVLIHSDNKEMVTVFKKILAWASHEYDSRNHQSERKEDEQTSEIER